jgi:Family of unknown function (DUF5690)
MGLGTLLRRRSADDPVTVVWFALALSCAYFCVYFWRYVVFVVPEAPLVPLESKKSGDSGDEKVASVSLKTLLAISQTLGFLCAKFPAIRVVTGFNRAHRLRLVVLLCASGALAVGLGFGLGGLLALKDHAGPGPWIQAFAVFLAAWPSSWIWGVVVTYTEGRRATEILLSSMSVLLVFAGGASRATGAAVAEGLFGNEYAGSIWMPLVVGGGALVPSLLLFWVVDQAPPPSVLDVAHRAERASMSMGAAWRLFVDAWPGWVTVIIGYAGLTAIRAFRDFFALEIYTAVLGEEPPAVFYIVADFPAAIISATALSALRAVVDNRRAALIMCGLMLLGTVILFATAVMQDDAIFGGSNDGKPRERSKFAGYMWAILVGTGIYLSYLPNGAMFFDRILAARRDVGTGVFLVFASDLAGYVGSVSLLVNNAVNEVEASTKEEGGDAASNTADVNATYLRFFVNVCYALSALNGLVFLLSTVYWWRRLPTGSQTHGVEVISDTPNSSESDDSSEVDFGPLGRRSRETDTILVDGD